MALLEIGLNLVRPALISVRSFHTTTTNFGKRNFRKFNLYEKRGNVRFKERYFKQDLVQHPLKKSRVLDQYYDRGVRPYQMENESGKLETVPEMIPELIVPDLEGFELLPYVSYRVSDLEQSEFTAQDLFFAVYSSKIREDYKNNKLDENGNSKEPSEMEEMTAEEAKNKALSTGSDIFQHIPVW